MQFIIIFLNSCSELFSKTHLCYLQHYLQVCYVSVLGIDEFMDVALPLLLLRAQRVQAVQVCTPCRATRAQAKSV